MGTVSLNVEKIRRWRREVVNRTVSVKRSSSQVIDGEAIVIRQTLST